MHSLGDLFHTRSVTGSTVSSTAATKVRSTTKKAALEAKLATLQKLYDLHIERVKNSSKKSGTLAASRNREAEAERQVTGAAEAKESRDLFQH